MEKAKGTTAVRRRPKSKWTIQPSVYNEGLLKAANLSGGNIKQKMNEY